MIGNTSLSTAPPAHPAQDYERLRAEGIALIQKLVGNVWTDFNAHDPGVTILEQVCYAITDLAYRIDYDMVDLLKREGKDAYASLPPPPQILPTRPVTLADLRKLVIDIPGIKNAWITPFTPEKTLYAEGNTLGYEQRDVTSEAVHLRGLYQVGIELDDIWAIDATNQPDFVGEAAKRLHTNRSLCEDFASIEILEEEFIGVKARIEIADAEDAERILLEIYQRLADFISPPVPRYTLDELIASGRPIETIFDGPLLTNGFIDTADLHPRRHALRTSDLIHEIMQIRGVLAVRHIEISKQNQTQLWSLELDPQRAPKFDHRTANIILERSQRAVPVRLDHIKEIFTRNLRNQAAPKPPAWNDLRRLPGRDRHIENFYPIQQQLPTVYGLSGGGENQGRQARQLQAYLLFFDQILANCFAQLAYAGDLFSFDAPIETTYFAQMVTGSSAVLLADRSRIEEIAESTPAHSEALTAEQAKYERQNRFLNHLLARFAENLNDMVLLQQTLTPKAQVMAKRQFVRQISELSQSRGLGINLLYEAKPPAKPEQQRSGLEKRLRHKLGLPETEPFFVIENILLRPLPGDSDQALPLLAETENNDPYSLRLSIVLTKEANPERKALIEQLVREETPAHLAVKIHWLAPEDMNSFSADYDDWWKKYSDYRKVKIGSSW